MTARTEALRPLAVGDRRLAGGAVRVAVAGELDLGTLPDLRAHLLDLVGAGCDRVEVDLGDVSFCDSSGLGLFVGVHRRLRSVGGRLDIVGAQPQVRRLFEISGLDQVFTVA